MGYRSLARRQRAGVLRKWLTVDLSGLLAGLLWKASVVVHVRLILRLRWTGLEGVVEQVLLVLFSEAFEYPRSKSAFEVDRR